MMKTTDLTSIGRPVDLSYPTNQAIAILTLVVMVGGAIVQWLMGVDWFEGALWGLEAGLTVFLAWALCRELDPDRALAAFVAAGLTLVGLFRADIPRLGVIFWLLVMVRVINRTTGLPAGVLDSLGLLGLSGWLSWQGNWGYSAIAALAFLLDGVLAPPNRRQLIFAALGVVVTVAVTMLSDGPVWGDGPSLVSVLMSLGLSLLFVPVILASRRIESVGDETGDLLHPLRVQLAQLMALLAGVETACWSGTNGLWALLPLWAAVLGAALYWAYTAIKH
jgi:hypothetical protein